MFSHERFVWFLWINMHASIFDYQFSILLYILIIKWSLSQDILIENHINQANHCSAMANAVALAIHLLHVEEGYWWTLTSMKAAQCVLCWFVIMTLQRWMEPRQSGDTRSSGLSSSRGTGFQMAKEEHNTTFQPLEAAAQVTTQTFISRKCNVRVWLGCFTLWPSFVHHFWLESDSLCLCILLFTIPFKAFKSNSPSISGNHCGFIVPCTLSG